jgi:hypothetical protein
MKERITAAVPLLSAAVFTLAAVGMSLKIEPFYTWFYLFAWWSYIFGAEALLHLRGGYSRLFDEPRSFFQLLPVSVVVWLVFEAFNFRLENWHYIGVHPDRTLRWLGYFFSFATVLPGISVTKRLLEFAGILEDWSGKPLQRPERLFMPCMILGAVFLLLPVLLPHYFFPLVWGGFIFLLEPAAYVMGGQSILRMWSQGSLRQFVLLLMAGTICGFFWESWNYWAGGKWYYTVPFVGSPKIFEMPVLGYLGFAPFAVECQVMTNTFRNLQSVTRSMPKRARLVFKTGLIAMTLLFIFTMFEGIDRFTVDGGVGRIQQKELRIYRPDDEVAQIFSIIPVVDQPERRGRLSTEPPRAATISRPTILSTDQSPPLMSTSG